MATYTVIPDTVLEPLKPIRSVDGLALRDNPIAIAEGASGAPRIQTAAIDTDAVTNPKVANGTLGAEKFQTGTTERDWVLARTASATAGAVGTYAFLVSSAGATRNFGDTESGTNLSPANASGGSSGTVSGTWRCMGRSTAGVDEDETTLWLRIS